MTSSELAQVGRNALTYFHNRSLRYAMYSISFEDLLSNLGTPKQIPIHLENLGDLIMNTLELSDGQVRDAMEALADSGRGRVPSGSTAYFQALGGKAGEINWIDLTKTVAADTAAGVASGFQQVGNATIASLKTLGFIAPMAVVAAVVIGLFVFREKLEKL